MNKDYDYLEKYWQKGGTYVLPVEIVNDLTGEIEDLQKENQKLKEHNEELEFIVGLQQKRGLISKFDKEFDEEDKRKNPNRDYARISPDAEEVYKRYYELKEQNEELKQKLNWIAFGDDSELALRYLRKIGYVDFDEERKVYINKHNNEPLCLDDKEEKQYYIKDEELNEYTQQLEYKLKQRNEIIEEAINYINKDYSVMEAPEIIRLEKILNKYKGDNNE